MNRGATESETCRLNGWEVGTRLEGDEGYGPSVIQITAIGEACILAKLIRHKGTPVRRSEGTWTLTCREWTVVA